jgi:glycosyltransferase involved in cell wall biosynthesis
MNQLIYPEPRPYFSIIMTSYNYANFVGQAIDSVISQTFEDWELIVVDDCSSDNSWDIIQAYTDPRIQKHRLLSNRGASHAYNCAVTLCRGQYIASLDSDDMFGKDKLLEQKKAF